MPRQPVKQALAEFLEHAGFEAIGHEEWDRVRHEFPDAKPGYLRRLLRESGLPLAARIEGVRQDGFAALDRTLRALEVEYSASGREGRNACRRLVIEAKDHARLALRRLSGDKAAEREEMIRWMIVWLENPAAYPAWARLRTRQMGGGAPPTDPAEASDKREKDGGS